MEPTPEKAPQSPEPISWDQTGIRTSLVSGIFCLIVLVLLIVNRVQSEAADPLYNHELGQLKAKLVLTPKDTALQKQIRALDLDLRQKHFHHQAVSRYGTWLLFGGVVVFLITFKPATAIKKVAKPPKQTPEQYFREISLTRYAVGGLGIVVAIGAFALSSTSTTYLASAPAEAAKPDGAKASATPTQTPYPTVAELKQNWPRFRGPFGAGISAYTNVPVKWDAASGDGILWKVEPPLSSPSSPVIWGDHIFLAGANATKREVYCYDLSGKLLWQKPVDPKRESAEAPTVMEDSGGFGPSTPCTDGRRVYAIFANGDVAAFDFAGNQVWARNLGHFENMYGHATSLEMYQNRLLVQLDQAGAKDGKSKVLALDSATGQTAWETAPRPVPASWATPIVVNNGQKDMIVTCGDPWVIAYDASNGQELWRAKAMGGEVLPSPVYSDGMVYTAISGEKLSAIPAKKTGDITSQIAWTAEDGLPDIVGPLCDGPRVYLLGSSGSVTCYDAKTGKKLWEKDLELNFKGSANLVGDKIYIVTENGVGVVLQAGNEFKEIARSALGEEVLSTPAFADGRIYIRAKKTLFCIGTKGK